MALIINSNIPGLNGQRELSRSERSLAKAFEALSSGKRINTAADDAAGLAISNRFSAQIRSINSAVRNANDGVGLVQTADAALGQAGDVLTRIRELAVQAGSGTLNASDRAAIQGEIDQLRGELDDIGDNTEFNTAKLLNGRFGTRSFQVGPSAGQTVDVTLRDARASALGARAEVTGGAANANAITGAGDLVINGTTIRATLNGDDTASTVAADTSAIAKAAAINSASGVTGVTATAGPAVSTGAAAIGAGNLAAGELRINGVNIGAVSGVQAGDAGGQLASAINARTAQTGVTATTGAGGELVLTAEDGRNIDIDVNGGGAALTGIAADTVARGTVTLTSDRAITVGGSDPTVAGQAATTTQVDTTETIAGIDVTTSQGLDDALATIDAAIGQVSSLRSELGATQNRLGTTLDNLGAVAENLAASRSRIEDTDFASKQAELIRAQLAQKAGIGIQAQANASARVVMSLLS